ncbi:CC2D2AN-C2 domain-containing protein [Meloidogyne graminicola]|uniref:CC2D2AN-C2 domain-containing protein n=1 Tax=Meloidogyne graminicola TaxID=189291 RepID=A0A8S9ZIA3_9BILA|nr:CC2D2AN-C2 domain-containing protein [Meloidogyne graminicola]
MSTFHKQNASQAWVETVQTVKGDTHDDEKTKRLKEISLSDKKIEQSIQLGTKYVDSQLHWEKQLIDDVITTTQSRNEQNKKRLLIYSSALPTNFESDAKFKQLIAWKKVDKNERKDDIEKAKEMDKISNMPDFNLNANLIKKFTQTNKTIWQKPISSVEWLKLTENRRWANQRQTGLWIDLQDIEFDHHWLFTRAEAAERELLAAYDAWVEVHQQVLNLVKSWFSIREQMLGNDEEIQEDAKNSEELNSLFNQIIERQTVLDRCRASLERAWAGTDQTRGRYFMERIKGNLEVFELDSKDELPTQLEAFFRSPLFVLSERSVKGDEEGGQQQQIPEIENQRRQAILNCRYQVQIFFNDLLVCSSQEQKMEWPEFTIPFGEIISLRIFEKPEQLCLVLKEKFGQGGNWQNLANIFVPLPQILSEEEELNDEGNELKNNKWITKSGIQFASTIVRKSFKGSLGCGQGGLPFTNGRLFCSVKWQGADEIYKKRIRHSKRIKKEEKNLIKNSILYEESLLYSEQILQSDLRLLLLKKRWNIRKNKNNNLIKELNIIPIEINKKIEKIEDDLNLNEEINREEETELEKNKRLGKEFILKLREHLRGSGEQQRRERDLAELIREEPIPNFSLDLITSLINGRNMDLSRRLKPYRGNIITEQHFYHDQKAHNCIRLIINIQSANAIPQRINNEPMQIYLVCSIKGQSQITSTSSGYQPNWHETLIFDIPFEKDFDEEETFLIIELFDREIINFEGDDREYDIKHERVENRWLGFASILLNSTAINYWKNKKMDGYLSLQLPLFYTGYKIPSFDEIPTTLRIRLSIDSPLFTPIINPSEHLKNELIGETDNNNIIINCLKFQSKFCQHFPLRRINTLAINSCGKKIIICQFLREIIPPIQIINLFNLQPKKAVKLASKITSSIPLIFEKNFNFLPIWLTVEEVVRIGYACPDELGILLCCWLMGLGLNCYVILGSTLSNGPNCAFVLIKFNDGEQWLIDPISGFYFSPTNPNCPLLSIGTVFNSKNIFINIQNGENPCQLNFDFSKKNCWSTIFGKEENLISIQSEYLIYEPIKEIDSNLLLETRTSLERELRLAFDETRPFAIPQWNLLASRNLNLRELLFAYWSQNFITIEENIQQQQKQIN